MLRKPFRSLYWMFLAAVPALLRADLTADQKEFDMRALAAHYAKHYAPYEWKIELFRFDLLELRPWISRARASRDDLEFYEICAEYVTSLRDTHSSFILPTNFSASLGLSIDIYDGKPLVDAVNRTLLPLSRFPVVAGWEVVSVDGVPAETLIDRFSRFVSSGNAVSRRRTAANYLGFRPQSRIPRAHEIGDAAEVVFLDRDGQEVTLTIPWTKQGTPLTSAGRLPSPPFRTAAARAPAAGAAGEEDITPPYLAPLAELRNERVEPAGEVLNYGSRFPVWAYPAGYQQRVGASASDPLVSGSFPAQGLRIGLIRIPNFSPPPGAAAALRVWDAEIAWMQENTDGLIVDVMRNNGGDACYNEEIQRRLIPYEFRGLGREIRVTTRWVNSFASALLLARQSNAPPHVIAQLERNLEEVQRTFAENRGRSGPLPICAETLTRQPAPGAYTKPVMVLVDPYSTSAADGFAAALQDAGRGPLFGMRTNGAGGTTGNFPTGLFSESLASHTTAMHHRRQPVVTPDYPTANYVENIGVRPDIQYDIMTRENLLDAGRPFVRAFTEAMVEHIQRSQP